MIYSPEKVPELMRQQNYSQVLRILYENKHPIIKTLFPAYADQFPEVILQDDYLSAHDINTLRAYVKQLKLSNTFTSLLLVAIGIFALLVSLIGFSSLLRVGFNGDTIFYTCVPLIGLYPLSMGLNGLKQLNKGNYGAW